MQALYALSPQSASTGLVAVLVGYRPRGSVRGRRALLGHRVVLLLRRRLRLQHLSESHQGLASGGYGAQGVGEGGTVIRVALGVSDEEARLVRLALGWYT